MDLHVSFSPSLLFDLLGYAAGKFSRVEAAPFICSIHNSSWFSLPWVILGAGGLVFESSRSLLEALGCFPYNISSCCGFIHKRSLCHDEVKGNLRDGPKELNPRPHDRGPKTWQQGIQPTWLPIRTSRAYLCNGCDFYSFRVICGRAYP